MRQNQESIYNTEKREQAIDMLCEFLADSYMVYLKLQNFHWNVKGVLFNDLHQMFEDQYKNQAEAVDMIAERISSLGGVAPGTMREFLELSTIEEQADVVQDEEMISILVKDHEHISNIARSLIPRLEEMGDYDSADMLIERMRAHNKSAWMLRNLLLG